MNGCGNHGVTRLPMYVELFPQSPYFPNIWHESEKYQNMPDFDHLLDQNQQDVYRLQDNEMFTKKKKEKLQYLVFQL